MPIIDLKTGSPEWLDYHNGRIGGHAAVALLLGGNPEIAKLGIKVRGTPLSVFLQLTGRMAEKPKTDEERTEEQEVAAELQWGIDTEDLHRKMLARDVGCTVAPGLVHQHPTHGWLMASVDGYANHNGQNLIVETKAPTWAKRDWRERAPWAAQLQCAFYAMVVAEDADFSVGLPEPSGGIVSALLPPTVQWEKFERDPGVEQWIMSVLIDFREKHWLRDIPPEPMGTDYKFMQRMWPKDTGKVILLPAECAEDAVTVATLSERISAEEKVLEAAKARIMARMEDATEAEIDGHVFTWKTETANYKAKEAHTVTKRVFRQKKGKRKDA